MSSQNTEIKEIRAPYNFVPLSKWIFTPPWADEVSHDVPFEDGISGTLSYTVTAETPILVGGEQDDHGGAGPNEVHFFQLPNEVPAIPGSSMRGMVRNVLEIVSFGKLNAVDDRRLAIRDISGQHVKDVYAQRILRKDKDGHTGPRAGFLTPRGDGGVYLVPCEYVRINHRDMERYVGWPGGKPIFTAGMAPEQKYKRWKESLERKSANFGRGNVDPMWMRFDIREPDDAADPTQRRLAVNLGAGGISGRLVFTGQISDCSTDKPKQPGRRASKGKYLDFVFYDWDLDNAFEVVDDLFRDFRVVHGEWDEGKEHRPWRDYWREQLLAGKVGDLCVPVFYRLEKAGDIEWIESIGLAYMYKLIYANTIGEVIGHTSPDHRNVSIRDFAELMFGCAVDPGVSDGSLRGRVSFGHAELIGSAQVEDSGPTILNGPKPSYFPNYIKQGVPQLGRDQQYRTYMDADAEVRGWKRYPVRSRAAVQPLTAAHQTNTKVQVRLHPLRKGSQFKGTVRFHNLKPEELGALLWVMTWGGNDALRHALGMGKPFGFGQVRIDIDETSWKTTLRSNDPQRAVPSMQACREAFEKCMFTAFASNNGNRNASSWRNSEQVRALCAMADPKQADVGGRRLEHMTLGERGINEFAKAKNAGLVLQPYTRRSPVGR